MKYSAAATVPPFARVKASQRRAWSGRQTPSGPRVPLLSGIDVTIGASTALEKAMTPSHCCLVRTPLYPLGGVPDGVSLSSKKVVFAHVPLTRI